LEVGAGLVGFKILDLRRDGLSIIQRDQHAVDGAREGMEEERGERPET
jgi:hypothetical protein